MTIRNSEQDILIMMHFFNCIFTVNEIEQLNRFLES